MQVHSRGIPFDLRVPSHYTKGGSLSASQTVAQGNPSHLGASNRSKRHAKGSATTLIHTTIRSNSSSEISFPSRFMLGQRIRPCRLPLHFTEKNDSQTTVRGES